MKVEKFFYRANLILNSPRTPYYERYSKLRDTPKGFVVVPCWALSTYEKGSLQMKRFEKLVLHSSINKWCYPTKEEALFALVKRTEVRRKILGRQIRAVNEFLEKGVSEPTEVSLDQILPTF